MEESSQRDREQRPIASFVLLKIKTKNDEINGSPLNDSSIAIDEFCMYGISINQLEAETKKSINSVTELVIPKKPRILHKLSIKQKIGPNNDSFNEDSGNAFISFIAHMRKPTCLVADRGNEFCFPIIKHKLDELQLKMPPNTLCMDATCAFADIDEHTKTESSEADIFNQRIFEMCDEPTVNMNNSDNRNERRNSESSESVKFKHGDDPTVNFDNAENQPETVLTLAERLAAETKTNWQADNECTPNQKIIRGVIRRPSNDSTPTTSTAALHKIERKKFASDINKSYDLPDMYDGNKERMSEYLENDIFNQRIFELCDEPTVNVDNAENQPETVLTLQERLDTETKTNWQADNECTPTQKIERGVKRRPSNDSTPTTSTAALQKIERKKFASDINKSYDLPDMYDGNKERMSEYLENDIFNQRIFELCDEPTVNVDNAENQPETVLTLQERLDTETKTNWQADNECTPTQKIERGVKRRPSNDSTPTTSIAALHKIERKKFASDINKSYDLPDMYDGNKERMSEYLENDIFNQRIFELCDEPTVNVDKAENQPETVLTLSERLDTETKTNWQADNVCTLTQKIVRGVIRRPSNDSTPTTFTAALHKIERKKFASDINKSYDLPDMYDGNKERMSEYLENEIFNQRIFELCDEPTVNVDKVENQPETVLTLSERFDAETETAQWRDGNETTPAKKIVPGIKRHQSNDSTPTTSTAALRKVRRKLFVTEQNTNKSYDLADMYERIFKVNYRRETSAEANVAALLHLIEVYRGHFYEYANNHAFPFEEILVGTTIQQELKSNPVCDEQF
ncbi:uncharacterized protein LOC114805203 isoform X5 [Zeugodacus cucurbitae]|uniref:uncharacterized protein LOC114805203 isoform X5 n=1 Tax=Zeugodacus cucurbitae TaxID=28588 RepID=UPI0023D92C46|nr:uncharacterized protein LOC114805203 isoform X5 [Zeugodacus cucurbitae]XP_054083027.1 uncharacterized protein LOC114805203 isoform X5 [Zeugodacus cucurbitae]XP_054083028.1 uncharacterized protein LOC114805203 isoform X5 [Zeugodacus cucurbitae]XP_054083029.1 uncharacterized protein LOC114805203 isoform X5 [Zeugodacus cucurbitae]